MRAALSQSAVQSLLQGHLSTSRGEYDLAIEAFLDAYKQDSTYLQAIRNVAELMIQMGRFKDASIHIQTLEKVAPNSFAALFLRGQYEYLRVGGDQELAIQKLDIITQDLARRNSCSRHCNCLRIEGKDFSRPKLESESG